MLINRRKLITGLISFAAAPAIVRASSLMPVKVMNEEFLIEEFNALYNTFIVPIRWLTYEECLKEFKIEAIETTGVNTIDHS